ncbi:MAG: alkaline phosphatase family protein [Acidobacteriia bacterium]|nr:alkaline phosphatase family protein [Terriglobia bacterium]
MRSSLRSSLLGILLCLGLTGTGAGSAYNARPKLVVIIVIDQFRGDYLERYRDQWGEGGFRLLLDHGANFTDCNYNYANTRTAPGHATLLTGAYTNGHGIMANDWWDPQKKAIVAAADDDQTKLVGVAGGAPGASPHHLLADTLGDELKLATQGKSRVFGIALKDRASVLPAGFAANGAYWIDRTTGAWITSTYYRSELPRWAQDFNDNKRAEKYLNQDWKDSNGNILRSTRPAAGKPGNFYDLVGSTPLANDYEFEFARELITYEKLGNGPATDLLIVSLSANDILGHKVGPDSAEMQAMALAMDRQLAGFFEFLGHQIGLANVWIALSADHGIAPLPQIAAGMHLPGANVSGDKIRAQINSALSARFSHKAEYVKDLDYPVTWLDSDAFAAVKVNEQDAERAVGEALKPAGLRTYYTRSQLERGDAPNTELGSKYLHSYSPLGGWYVLGVPPPFTIGFIGGTDHATPYTYDTHVPLAFYGLPFQPGTYRTHAEPVDLAPTLASLLGINAPTHSVGRVLTEALPPSRRVAGSVHGGDREERSMPDVEGLGFRQGTMAPPSQAATSAAEAANHRTTAIAALKSCSTQRQGSWSIQRLESWSSASQDFRVSVLAAAVKNDGRTAAEGVR